MAVIRVNHTENYTVMSNWHLRDKSLSLKAKGLLSQMLSLPPTWDYTIAGLVAINQEKKSAITNTLKELRQHGYLVVTKKMPNETESGRIEYIYDIYEHPQTKQIEEKQDIENLCLENQCIENHTQLNTKQLNTEKLNTDIKIIVDYLNSKAGTAYRASGQNTVKHIKARLNEGFTIEDFKTVIDKKVIEWKGTDMEKYLRPETLFGTKFESYLNAKTVTKRQGANGVKLSNTYDHSLDGIL